MTQANVTPGRSEAVSGKQLRRLLAVLVTSAGCCATASGATSPMTACDRTADLQSLEVPVSELSASVVGHIVVESENEGDEPLAALPVQSPAPILDLAPRVAVILQEVFSAVAIETPPLDQIEPARTYVIDASAKEDSPLSPVAGDAGPSEAAELAESDSGIDDTNAELGVRHQMFRTDI